MSSIDKRVVEARFDNKQFESGVKETLDSLSSLKKGLQLDGATKGLSDIDAAARRLSLAGLSDSVDNLANQFSALRIAGVAALSAIAVKAAHAGINVIKSLSISPVMEGLREYETNLNSIQTILSNTQWENKNLQDVNAALQELNEYSDLTIYNFAEMARNIGTFTAAGVELDTSVAAIKGIANLAAVSGSNSQQAATAMYQLSQALSTGTVKLMDWNSVVNAGMGGKVFQDAIKETARNHGIAIDQIIEQEGSFRDSLSEGWFSTDILTETLSKFTGDLNAEQLKQMGYTQDQIEEILKLGKTATDAATKIKTVSQLIGTLQETAGSGWSQTWQLIFGDFEEAKDLWTGVNDTVGAFIDTMSDARNSVLKDWKDLGGRTALIEAVTNAFRGLISVVKPIGEAFKEIFPPTTGAQLFKITETLRNFFENFKMGAKEAENLKRTFAGFFAVLGIGWEILKSVTVFLADIFRKVTEGSGGILAATGNIGDFFVALHQAVKQGEGLTKFFERLSKALEKPIMWVKSLAKAILDLFDFEAPSADGIIEAFKPLGTLGAVISKIWSGLIGVLEKVWNFVQPFATKVADFFGSIAGFISDALSGMDVDYTDVLATINTGLFGGFLVLVKQFINNFHAGDFLENLTAPFEALSDTLGTMQNTLRATTLLQIAAAVGILAASTMALSKVDEAGLKRALVGLSALFVQLFAALAAFQFIGGARGLTATATGLVVFATALRVLVSSVKALSELTWEELAKGLSGVAVLISAVTVAVRGMSGNTAGMFTAGAGLLVLAAGIKILASAVEDISDLSWADLSRGLVGVASLLASLAIFTKLSAVNKGAVTQSVGLLVLAGAIKLLASAVEDFSELSWEGIGKGLASISAILAAFTLFTKGVGNPAGLVRAGASLLLISGAMYVMAEAFSKFGNLSWENIGKGLAAMAGSLAAMSAALNLMPPSTLASATSLVIVAGALQIVASVLSKMGQLGWDEIGRGLATLAGSLLIIAVAVNAMTGALGGAAALLVVSGALAIFTPVLLALSKLSWEEVARGLGTLAGAFIILGVAGLALTPVIPTLLGLAGSIALLGAGVALAGAGILALSVGLTTLAAAGAGVTAAIVAIASALIGMIPMLAKQLGMGLVVLAEVIGEAGPAMSRAMTAVISAIIESIRTNHPQAIELIAEMLSLILDKLIEIVPEIANAALEIIIGILNAFNEHIPTIVSTIAGMLVAILNAMTEALPSVIKAATDLIVAFLEGVADNLKDVISAGADIVIALIEGISENMVDIIDAGMEAIVNFVNGVADAINEHAPDLHEAGRNLAVAIADGMSFGLTAKIRDVASSAANLARGAYNAAKDALDIHSPSKEFQKLGEWTAEGFALGLRGGTEEIYDAWNITTQLLTQTMESVSRDVQQLEGRIVSLTDAQERNAESILRAEANLSKLQKAKKKDHEAIRRATVDLERLKDEQKEYALAIKETETALVEAREEKDKTAAAIKAVNEDLADERAELEKLGKQYDEYVVKIDNAQRALEDAIRTRDDYMASISDQYGDLPRLDEETGLEDYINQLTYANADLLKFAEVMQQLRDLGLSDALYEEFLAAGPSILPFVEELLIGGRNSIEVVNELSADLAASAEELGKTASAELYQAGVDAASGLLFGLKSKASEIEATMAAIANSIVEVLKLQLEIKSPSRVFYNLGAFTVAGMALGMEKSAPIINKAAMGIGNTAIDAMKKSISDMNDILALDADMRPVISPVLDLSGFRKEAGLIDTELAGKTVSFAEAYAKAKYASFGYQANEVARADSEVSSGSSSTVLTYNQYNSSPKALSPADIYRQTKNQLSKTKGALTPNVAQEA